MSKSITVGKIANTTLFYGLLLAGAVFISLPTIWMLGASLMTSAELFSPTIRLLPSEPRIDNYITVFAQFNFARYLTNSIIVTGSVIVLNLIFCPMVGYGLAKFKFPGRNVLFLFIMATIMVPFAAILIPLYLLVRDLGWINSYQAMIVPFAMTAIGVFLMRQFAYSIPDDYIEAARIDGASELGIYLRIIVPLMQPAMITLAIITFVLVWDEFLWVLVVTTTDQYRTLPIGLVKFREAYQTRWELIMAGSTVAAAPAVLLFVLLQRRFLEGIASLSGMK
jgi:multiple sugar transport system permease protein